MTMSPRADAGAFEAYGVMVFAWMASASRARNYQPGGDVI
jgi:hypothetical protein